MEISFSGQPKALFIVGPTAVGKTEVAHEVAKQLDGEIINADSMQLYRGLDIGTAKPSQKLRSELPYHLYDIRGIDESMDATIYAELAYEKIADVWNRQRVPIVVGGTGFYFSSSREAATRCSGHIGKNERARSISSRDQWCSGNLSGPSGSRPSQCRPTSPW